MRYKIRQLLDAAQGVNLTGDDMLVRLRTISIGLLGAVTAVALGLIVFISQQGWPGVLSGPLPGAPTKPATIHDAVALGGNGQPAAPALALSQARRAATAAPGGDARAFAPSSDSPGVGGSQALEQPSSQPAASQPQPASPQPSPPAAPVASPQPAASPAPAAAPAPVGTTEESPLKSNTSGQSQQTSSGSKPPSLAAAKVKSDAKGQVSAVPSSTSRGTQGKGSTGSTSTKSTSVPAAKAAADSAGPPPAPVTAGTTSPAASEAAGKAAADAAK